MHKALCKALRRALRHRMRSAGLLAGLIASVAPAVSVAETPAPVGRWQTVDDRSGEPKAIIEIREVNGQLQGRIARLLKPSHPHPVCEHCEGDRKNQPVEGMTILWDVRSTGSGLTDGKILDPENGKIYGAHLEPESNGQKLKVRGYLGFALLGRTQEWTRVD